MSLSPLRGVCVLRHRTWDGGDVPECQESNQHQRGGFQSTDVTAEW